MSEESLTQLRSEVDRWYETSRHLLRLLSKYGDHLPPCKRNPCTCGLEAALKQMIVKGE
jgi:hypothetical protein